MGNLGKIKLYLFQYDISIDPLVEIKNENSSHDLNQTRFLYLMTILKIFNSKKYK